MLTGPPQAVRTSKRAKEPNLRNTVTGCLPCYLVSMGISVLTYNVNTKISEGSTSFCDETGKKSYKRDVTNASYKVKGYLN